MEPPFNRLRISLRARSLLGLCALLLLCATPALAGGMCPAAPIAPIELPHLRAALVHGEEVVIVALGSSSTLGVMASDPAHSYPAVLQRALSTELADGHIAVINRGIGGQDAREELARLDADVLALRPQVVIWQVGANGALRHTDPEQFRQRVTEGVRKIRAAGADIILMDNQQSPRLLARKDEPVFDETLAQVASETGASLFSRRALMKTWEQGGAPPAEFIATDGLHHNDRGYYCVATTLAREIVKGLAADRPQTASR